MSTELDRPSIPYGRQTIEDDDVEAVVEALRAPLITQGPRIEAFERALCAATGAGHAVAVSSGTAALHLAYAAAGLGPGDELVTSPNTFLATANAAVFLGARPLFADVEQRHHNLDPAAAEAAVTARTRALVAVDFAGHPADFAALREVADRRGLRLLADASHSLGARYRGRPVGTLADLTCLSFHPVKAITTGEGGAVLTDDAALARVCRELRTHGVVRGADGLGPDAPPWAYEMRRLGFNYRVTDLQCALGRSQLGKLDRFLRRRRVLARRYAERLRGLADVVVPHEAEDVESAWHLYVVLVPAERRRSVFEAMRADGIGVQVHYIPVYRQPYYARLLAVAPERFPHAERYYARAISLPLYPGLTEQDQDRVVDSLTRSLA